MTLSAVQELVLHVMMTEPWYWGAFIWHMRRGEEPAALLKHCGVHTARASVALLVTVAGIFVCRCGPPPTTTIKTTPWFIDYCDGADWLALQRM
jgi:hypothetical protein